jgi:hypothetical protein
LLGSSTRAAGGAVSAFATTVLVAPAATSPPVPVSTVNVMSDSARPNEEALVINRVTPLVVTVQRYSAWVWPEMITLIEGSSREAMSRIGLPARLPAHPFSVAGDVWKPPWWITSTGIVTPRRCSARTAAFPASASSVKVSPATPDGVTIVGVSLSTSPMNPTRIALP